MSTFVGKDPRGIAVVLPQARFDHSIEGHFAFLGASTKGLWHIVTNALENPLLIIDNPPLTEATDGPPRVAGERYCAFVQEWQRYLIVPVRKFDTGHYTEAGKSSIPAPVRVAWTAYDDTKVPVGNIIWSST